MAEVSTLLLKECSENASSEPLLFFRPESRGKVAEETAENRRIERYLSAGEVCISQPFQDFSAVSSNIVVEVCYCFALKKSFISLATGTLGS